MGPSHIKRSPLAFTSRCGVSTRPTRASWIILVCVVGSISPPAHTPILWPSPVRFIWQGGNSLMSGQ